MENPPRDEKGNTLRSQYTGVLRGNAADSGMIHHVEPLHGSGSAESQGTFGEAADDPLTGGDDMHTRSASMGDSDTEVRYSRTPEGTTEGIRNGT